MEIPHRFKAYPCEEYFQSEQFVNGVFDSHGLIWFLVSASDVTEKPELDFLVIGRPGADGIEFGFRKDGQGIWAYYPIEQKFVHVAPNLAALIDGWLSGQIKV
jgi:hypothetical protein